MLVIKNGLRFGVTHTVGCIFMFLGKLFIIIANAALTYVMVTKWEKPAS